jgi:hypothetical protein
MPITLKEMAQYQTDHLKAEMLRQILASSPLLGGRPPVKPLSRWEHLRLRLRWWKEAHTPHLYWGYRDCECDD